MNRNIDSSYRTEIFMPGDNISSMVQEKNGDSYFSEAEIEARDMPLTNSVGIPGGFFGFIVQIFTSSYNNNKREAMIKERQLSIAISNSLKNNIESHNDRYSNDSNFRSGEQSAIDKGESRERMEKADGTGETKMA